MIGRATAWMSPIDLVGTMLLNTAINDAEAKNHVALKGGTEPLNTAINGTKAKDHINLQGGTMPFNTFIDDS